MISKEESAQLKKLIAERVQAAVDASWAAVDKPGEASKLIQESADKAVKLNAFIRAITRR